MRSLILLAPLALLAACSGNKAGNNVAGNGAAPAATNVATPPVTMAPAGNSTTIAPPPARANDPRRTELTAECNQAVPGVVPAGSDVAGLCNCAVERVLGGESEEQATMACAAQLGITVDASKI